MYIHSHHTEGIWVDAGTPTEAGISWFLNLHDKSYQLCGIIILFDFYLARSVEFANFTPGIKKLEIIILSGYTEIKFPVCHPATRK